MPGGHGGLTPVSTSMFLALRRTVWPGALVVVVEFAATAVQFGWR